MTPERKAELREECRSHGFWRKGPLINSSVISELLDALDEAENRIAGELEKQGWNG